MDHMLQDRNFYKNHTPNYKRTTEKQYSLLKSRMSISLEKNQDCFKNNNANGILRFKQNNLYWKELTEKLNNLGPPHRTMQQWKKVWCDFKRSERKRHFKSLPKVVQDIKKEFYDDNEIYKRELDETTSETSTSNKLEIYIKSETKDYEQNSQSMYTTYSNEYNNDYSYPDEDSRQESYMDEKETSIPDESSSSSYSYLNKSMPGSGSIDQTSSNKHFSSPPPLQPANISILDQSMYTLQNQMEHQTKVLENLFEMSNTMASLMECQVEAVEKQTEVMHRQALATERHTEAMNNFIDMIREKIFKENSQKVATLTI